MANLHLLKTRLKSINTTGEMAAAMKTVASVKYSKIAKKSQGLKEYAKACEDVLSLTYKYAFKRTCDFVEDRNMYIVISSNRGFCGGYNSELLKFYESEIKNDKANEKPIIVACGNKAQKYFSDKNADAVTFEISDIPTISEAEQLAKLILDKYESGQANHIYVIYQSYKNMMTQIPEKTLILPLDNKSNDENNSQEIIFIPDIDSFAGVLSHDCMTSEIYSILIQSQMGAQTSTIIAMRNACDNAQESAQNLELTINRIRQAQVTNSVIETSSGMLSKDLEK